MHWPLLSFGFASAEDCIRGRCTGVKSSLVKLDMKSITELAVLPYFSEQSRFVKLGAENYADSG
jgi:hypothetical protein